MDSPKYPSPKRTVRNVRFRNDSLKCPCTVLFIRCPVNKRTPQKVSAQFRLGGGGSIEKQTVYLFNYFVVQSVRISVMEQYDQKTLKVKINTVYTI